MKSIGVTLQRTYLTKNCKKNIVRHPAKLSNILALMYTEVEIHSTALADNFLGILRKLQINYLSKTSLNGYFKLASDISPKSGSLTRLKN